MRYVGIALVQAWRHTFGLLTPAGTCKYHPSCSQYALDAFRIHGLCQGRALRRLAASALQPLEPRWGRPGRGRALRPPPARVGAPGVIAQILAISNPLRPLEHFLQRVLVWLHE